MNRSIKLASFVVVFVMLLVACAPAAPAAPTAAPVQPVAPASNTGSGAPFRVAVIIPSTVTDMAWSQSIYDALVAIQTQMGGKSAMEIKYSENLFNVPDAAAAIRDYASQGFDMVIAHGTQYNVSIAEVAKDFPKTTFVYETGSDTFGLPNVIAYDVASQEGGYVNGVMAAKLTKTKKIGIIGPVQSGDDKTYFDGFMQGIKSVDPSINVSQTWTGSFSDVTLMTQAAKTHIANGEDVLAGSSQSAVGAIAVVKANGKVLWFGDDVDQSSLAPNVIVACQLYNWKVSLMDMVNNHKAGKLGGVFTLHLGNSGLEIIDNPAFALPADVKAAADAAIKGINDGSVTVYP
jgi:basic membrane protein A and related proteins